MLVGRNRQSSASVVRGQKEAVERRYAEGMGICTVQYNRCGGRANVLRWCPQPRGCPITPVSWTPECTAVGCLMNGRKNLKKAVG